MQPHSLFTATYQALWKHSKEPQAHKCGQHTQTSLEDILNDAVEEKDIVYTYVELQSQTAGEPELSLNRRNVLQSNSTIQL